MSRIRRTASVLVGVAVVLTIGLAPAGAHHPITSDEIANQTIKKVDIGPSAVGQSEIVTDGVGKSEIASNAVGRSEILTDGVSSPEIAAAAVGASEIATGAVGASEIAAGAVGASEIATGAVGASEIAADAVGSSEIATGAVGASEIAAGAVGASEIATGAVGADEIATGAVVGGLAGDISDDSITTDDIAAGGVGSSEIAADAVDSSEIATGAVGSAEIAADAVTSAKIGAGEVGTSDLAATIQVETADTYTAAGSFQLLAADLTLGTTAGTSDPTDSDFLGAAMGNVLGADLTNTHNYVSGVIGHYSVTGTNASTYPVGGVLAGVGDGTTTADGAVVAYIDGDSATTTAGAAFKVMSNNSTAASGFDFGVDLQDGAHDGYQAVDEDFYLKAPIRMVRDVVVLINDAAPTSGASGTGDDVAGPGSLYVDTTGAKLYINTGTISSPTWTVVGTQTT